MLFCEQPSLERRYLDFSSAGLAGTLWTRVMSGQVELCNSLEWTEWGANPTQVQICEACGVPRCASGGYTDVSTLGDVVLWTAPSFSDTTDGADEKRIPATAIREFGSVAFRPEVWNLFRESTPNVPQPREFPCAEGRAIRNLWAFGAKRPRIYDDGELLHWLSRRLDCADTLDTADAIRWVEHWLRWLGERATAAVDGHLEQAGACGAEVETLYLNGAGLGNWPALARYRGSFVPALDADRIFVPEL